MTLDEMDEVIAKVVLAMRGWHEVPRRRAIFIAGMREAARIAEKERADKARALDIVLNTADQLEREAEIARRR